MVLGGGWCEYSRWHTRWVQVSIRPTRRVLATREWHSCLSLHWVNNNNKSQQPCKTLCPATQCSPSTGDDEVLRVRLDLLSPTPSLSVRFLGHLLLPSFCIIKDQPFFKEIIDMLNHLVQLHSEHMQVSNVKLLYILKHSLCWSH